MTREEFILDNIVDDSEFIVDGKYISEEQRSIPCDISFLTNHEIDGMVGSAFYDPLCGRFFIK